MVDESLTLDQLQARMNWGLREIDYQLQAENLMIVRRGGKTKFVFLTRVTAPEQSRTQDRASHLIKHVGRKSLTN